MKNRSPRASRLINGLCQNEARKYGCDQIYPEHLLLAMINKGEGLGYLTLRKLRINLETLKLSLEQNVVSNSQGLDESSLPENIPLGLRTLNVLDLSELESQTLGNSYVGTEHVLLGLLREQPSVTSSFFQKAEVTASQARAAVKEVQREEKSSAQESREHEQVYDLFKDIFGVTESLKNTNDVFQENKEASGVGDSQKVSSKAEKQSFLAEYSRDLTKMALEGDMDLVVGRDKEIRRLIQILSRRTKNNPVLVGEPGIGKTAIVEGFAQFVAKGKVPSGLLKKRVLSLDLAALVAGTKYRGEFEERMKKMMNEVKSDPSIILFIDELHTIIGAGGPEGTMDASNMLKPALSRGEIQIIGTSTTKEYSRHIEKDAALARRFQMIRVEEPSDQDTIEILEGIKKQYEDFHKVVYDKGVISSIVKLSRRYIPERFLPDKAIDILDEAGAQKKILEEEKPSELLELEQQINDLIVEKENLVKEQAYESAAFVRDKVVELKRKFQLYSDSWKENGNRSCQHVTIHDICEIIGEMTGIPVDQLDSAESMRLVKMEEEMHKIVIGQDEAVHLIAGAVRRSRSGISSPKHPIGSFIFLGPTGVGKTQLAKALAKFLFGSEDQLIRIDMSDFMEKHNASRLVGAPPGYVGYEDGGVLTEQVRQHPYSVVLLDEIEKAHPDVFNLLLQLLEEGELRDNLGHSVNFRNTVVIMTSNAGSRHITTEGRVGFFNSEMATLPYEEIRSGAMSELKKLLSPELINRIDDIIVFNALSKDQVSQILDIQIAELSSRLSERNLSISICENARKYLVDNGYEPSMGARPMRRLIQKEIEDPLSLEILDPKNKDLSHILVDFKKGKLCVHFEKESQSKKISQLVNSTSKNNDLLVASSVKTSGNVKSDD